MRKALQTCIFLFLIAPAVQAANPAPQQAVDAFLKTILSMNFPVKDPAAHQQRVTKADAYLDLEAMGKEALAAHWSEASSDQQKQFVDLLWKLIESIAYPRSKKFLNGLPIEYQKPKSIARGVEVNTVVKNQDEALNAAIVYNLYEENGQWKIYDIFLDGVSITEDLRSQFDRIVKESSFTGLLTRMQERLAKARQEISQ